MAQPKAQMNGEHQPDITLCRKWWIKPGFEAT